MPALFLLRAHLRCESECERAAAEARLSSFPQSTGKKNISIERLRRWQFGIVLAAFAKATPKVFASGRRAKGAPDPP